MNKLALSTYYLKEQNVIFKASEFEQLWYSICQSMDFPINISFCTVQCTNKTHNVKNKYNITYLGTEDRTLKLAMPLILESQNSYSK